MYRFGQSSRFRTASRTRLEEVSFFYLLCQRPHRSSDKTFDPSDHIFISRRTEKKLYSHNLLRFLPHSHRSSRHEELPVISCHFIFCASAFWKTSPKTCARYFRDQAPQTHILPGLKAAVRNLKNEHMHKTQIFPVLSH